MIRSKQSGSSLAYSRFSGAPSFDYSYNADGTINSETIDATIARQYTYDSLGQLNTVDDQANDLYYTYTYDSAGNILTARAKGLAHSNENYANTYTYGNASWADLLTAFNGKNIAYEGQTYNASTGTVSGTVRSGNPISYYNGTRWTFAWQNGRRLASANNGTTSISYTYDLNGLRTGKTVGTVEHRYVYASGLLLRETYGNVTLDFSYGINGTPYSMTYTNGSAAPVTYYITNLQNDVIYMVTESGTKVAEYSYDPYGKVTIATGSMANINPLRYRGYYYDTETGFYYVSSRYYDPEVGRFINADTTDVVTATPMALTDKNLFAYCDNNPVIREDKDGQLWNFIIGGTVGALVGGISAAISSYKSTGSVNWGSVAIGAASGLIGGLVGASGIGALGQAAISGATSALSNIGNSLVKGEKINWQDVVIDAAIGAGSSLLGSAVTRKASDAANKMVKKGIGKIVTGKTNYDNGSRYWKGAVKKGFRIMREGLHQLNVARGKASVIGSASGGVLSIGKALFF